MINMTDIASELRSFNHSGVTFWDLESITEDGDMWNLLVETMSSRYKNQAIDFVVCLDARGFLLGGAIACALGKNVGIKLVRKAGKLPGPVHSVEYGLEYRDKDVVEIQDSKVMEGKRVLIIDDVLATGGTAEAAVKLVEQVGGIVVGLAFAIELPSLEGRAKLLDYAVSSEISIIEGKPCANVEYCVDMMVESLDSNTLLLIQRLNEPAGIAMVGGRIENSESASEALDRELWEETGLDEGNCTATYHSTLVGLNRDPRGVKVSLVFIVNADTENARGEAGKTQIMLIKKSDKLPAMTDFAFDHGLFVHHYRTGFIEPEPKMVA